MYTIKVIPTNTSTPDFPEIPNQFQPLKSLSCTINGISEILLLSSFLSFKVLRHSMLHFHFCLKCDFLIIFGPVSMSMSHIVQCKTHVEFQIVMQDFLRLFSKNGAWPTGALEANLVAFVVRFFSVLILKTHCETLVISFSILSLGSWQMYSFLLDLWHQAFLDCVTGPLPY